MKCNRCRGPAVIEVRRHNAAYCKGCFIHVFHEQVKRAIRQHDMFAEGDRILVAISGGKDSLALWDVLLDLGYDVTGLYLGLGIGGYSDRSGDTTKAFAAERDAELIVVDLERDYGYDIPTAGRKGSRSTCAVCGLSKRYVFNRAALEGGFDVIATGHNLDDEAATLLGNTLRWQTEYIARQSPALPGKEGMVQTIERQIRDDDRQGKARQEGKENHEAATLTVKERQWNHRRQNPPDVGDRFAKFAVRMLRCDPEERKEEAHQIVSSPAPIDRLFIRNARRAGGVRNQTSGGHELERGQSQAQRAEHYHLHEDPAPRRSIN